MTGVACDECHRYEYIFILSKYNNTGIKKIKRNYFHMEIVMTWSYADSFIGDPGT